MNFETISAKCDWFGQCGGCAHQDLAYRDQLVQKQNTLQELFDAWWSRPIPITPSPDIWNYRNKVDFNFGRKQYDEKPPDDFIRDTVLGFNKKGKWYWPLDIDKCHIAPASAKPIMDAVRNWYIDKDIRGMNNRNQDGILKVLLLRESKRTGQVMVALITGEGDLDEASFVQIIESACPAVHSIYRGIHRGTARGAFADELILLKGEPAIQETLHIADDGGDVRELSFRISPMSFFQTNSSATELLYGEIRKWVKKIQPDILYDLYGGAGGIAFTCSDLVQLVRSVEVVESATLDGEANAKQNGIDNVFFMTSTIKTFLQQMIEGGGMEANSAVVVDPPREGMTPKPLKRLLKTRPPHVLYVSCKPSVFAEEMKEFSKGYRLTNMQAVDLFPHTNHVELVATLERKNR
jgi:23S rRNA (uracil-5-)-methyltransferase RumA